MITTMCVNPTIDKLYEITGFNYGGMNRVSHSRSELATKGVNIAKVVTALGLCATATGIMYTGSAGDAAEFEKLGISTDYVYQQGRVRDCIKIFDDSKGVVSEFNESGQPVDPQNVAALRSKIRLLAGGSDWFVTIGSLPQGIEPSFFGESVAIAKAAGAKTVLDAEGAALMAGLASLPYMVKVNGFELSTAAGHAIDSLDGYITEAVRLHERGVAIVAVSLGGDGALLIDGGGIYRSEGVKVKVMSTVGAGDSMIGGLLYAYSNGADGGEALRCGVAAASGTCTLDGTGIVDRALFTEMYPQAAVQKL